MTNPLFLSLMVGAFVGGAAGYLGSLMVTRKMALVGDALGHIALPGMGLALLLKVDVTLGAFVFLALGILLIWRLGEKTSLSSETVVGIVFVSSLAVGFLIVPEPELLESLIGDIGKVSFPWALISVGVSIGVVILVNRIYPGMMLMSISVDLASVEGIAATRYNLIYLAAIALIVSIGVKVTGSLLVGALVIIPPATARMISRDMQRYASSSVAIGVISSVAGIVVSRMTRFPAGPSIILVGALLFLLALVPRRTRPV
ncbi:MAG: metal ABC transporter permease [Steroidobacteraceae bacterium]|jgi:ABC-type Mn2+/Zn2+ transport system permease subunit